MYAKLTQQKKNKMYECKTLSRNNIFQRGDGGCSLFINLSLPSLRVLLSSTGKLRGSIDQWEDRNKKKQDARRDISDTPKGAKYTPPTSY